MEFEKIDIQLDECLYRCSVGMHPPTIMEDFLPILQDGNTKIQVQYDAAGMVSSACLRTMWRFLLFRGKTAGQKINLYHEDRGSPGELVHRFSKLILFRSATADETPDEM